MGGYAWVTLATNDAYSLGALVLAHSLRRVGTKYELAVLVTPGVTEMMREKLAAVFSLVQEVNVLDSKDEANLALLARPELGVTFTKLHCWRLTQYDKCVFVDADTLVVRNCDELFEREELSAAPDVGWPDCFNSGVFVFRPSQQTFASITAFAAAKGSFDGGDQGLLNMYFNDWARKDISKHLPFIYNMCSTATYSYLPAFKQFGEDVRIIHFIGITKPWLQYFDTLTGIVQPPAGSTHLQPLLQLWWNIFCDKVHPQLSPVMATSTLAPIWHEFSPMPLESPFPKSPVHTDTIDKVKSDTYLETPDFSEFKDPWDYYCVQNDPVVNYDKPSYETERCTCIIDRSAPQSPNVQYRIPTTPTHRNSYESPSSYISQSYNEQQHKYHFSPPHVQSSYNEEHYNKSNGESRQEHTPFHAENRYVEQHFVQQSESSHWQNQERTQPHYVDNTQQYQQTNHQNYHTEQNHHFNQHSDQSHDHRDHWHQHVEQHQHNYGHSVNHSHTPVVHEEKQHYVEQHNSNIHYQHNEQNIVHQRQDNENSEWHKPHYEQHNQTTDHGWHKPHCEQHNQNNEWHQPHYEQPIYENQKNDHEWHKPHYEQKDEKTNHECQIHPNREVSPQRSQQVDMNIAVNHEQSTQAVVFCPVHHKLQQSNEQHENHTTDKRTDTQIPTSSPTSSPCTDLHNVATQSDPNITEQLENSNAGLAGALAQMTLGEPRSAEQIALEEHMRKQSWEQGQIDYMGRDSFDNIWKKICETLALAPPRLPSPPKETRKPVEPKTDETDETVKTKNAADIVETVKAADSNEEKEVDKKAVQAITGEQSVISDIPVDKISTQETSATIDIVSIQDNVSKLPEKDEESIDVTLISITKDIEQVSISSPLEQTAMEDASEKLLMELECKLVDTSIQSSSAKPTIQTSIEAIAEQLPTSTLPEEITQPVVAHEPSNKIEKSIDVVQQEILPETVPDSANTADTIKNTVETTSEVESPTQSDKTISDSNATIRSDTTSETKGEDITIKSDETPCTKDDSTSDSPTQVTSIESLTSLEFTSSDVTTKESTIGDERHAEVLSAASEVLTVSPVPIQVAESVLQAEPKESISDDPRVAAQEVVSSTVTPVHEFTAASNITKPLDKVQINGSVSTLQPSQKTEKTTNNTVSTVETAGTTSKLAEVTQAELPQVPASAEQIVSAPIKETSISSPSTLETVALSEEVIPEQKVAESVEPVEKVQDTVKECTESTTVTSKSEVTSTPPQSPSTESPVKPAGVKGLNIPSTPTITEPTPPTSPPVTTAQQLEEQEKATKKTVKKAVEKSAPESETTETVEGDSAEKKVVKKVVKKLVKKPKTKSEEAPDDGAESSGTPSKQKKTVKVIKKGTKPSQTLGADVPVPETPPPGTSDAPIPPKRKVKSTTAKSVAAKKSDVEQ